MTNEHTGFSRRKLLKAGAIGVPAAGVLAFGSTLSLQPPPTLSPPTAGGAPKPRSGYRNS